MSCDTEFERTYELPATPDVVWDELPGILDDEGRARVVEHEDAPHHLSFWWAPESDDEPPSHVAIELEPDGDGTIVHIRETRLAGADLLRSAFSARARI
jgi:hypothetical protein